MAASMPSGGCITENMHQLWFGLNSVTRNTARSCDCKSLWVFIHLKMTTETRNWAVVAAAMEAQGATNSEMYRRAKALSEGMPDPMPTSYPAAPQSISAA